MLPEDLGSSWVLTPEPHCVDLGRKPFTVKAYIIASIILSGSLFQLYHNMTPQHPILMIEAYYALIEPL